ncbi:MAG: phage integrase family protein [Bacteroidetes bacterium]|jgi:site-specific recombinase XerD|nr:phage integrase family protein [Bacteroidota bacterium]
MLTDFETYMLKHGYTKDTSKTYVFQVSPFVEAFPDAKYFTFKDVKEALGEFLKHHKNQNYKHTILCSIKKYYDFLIESRQRNDHPCRTLNFRTVKNKSVIHYDLFSSAELELLMEREERFPLVRTRNQVVVSLLIYQGLQSQEIINLKVHHVDFDKGTIYIKENSSTTRRHLEMHPKQYKIFDSYINESRRALLKVETDQLVVGMRGTGVEKGEVQYLVKTFKPLFPDRNLSPETIRQSVISNWLNERKFPLDQVQLMAGHRFISSTAKYRQTPADEKRLIINRLHPLG